MRKGEKGILIGIVVFSLVMMAYQGFMVSRQTEEDPGIPFYSTASKELQTQASLLVRRYNCRDCHSLWGLRNIMQSVPSPSLDGMGSLRTETWLFDYFSAEDPQSILPSRLKQRFRMPSFADLPESERRLLAVYIASLKVEDWYLKETQKAEYEKLTGEEYTQ